MTFRSDGTDMFMDINTLRDELKIMSKLQVFAGNLLCGAVCTNCFEKCTDFFANIKDDSRNAPKRLRKTVILFGWVLFYFTVFNREKMHFYCMQLLHIVIWKVCDPKAIGYRITAWRITVTSAFWKCVLMIIKGKHDMIRFLLSTFSLLSSSRTAVHILGSFVVSTMSLQSEYQLLRNLRTPFAVFWFGFPIIYLVLHTLITFFLQNMKEDTLKNVSVLIFIVWTSCSQFQSSRPPALHILHVSLS